ncbi:hypothetical protein EU537_00165 [Candidatus Thorarchaeota archaeon]|nr:MAG: hypothetical protein EU537_00165 [Candidatus Thorarchaeota archaeon]
MPKRSRCPYCGRLFNRDKLDAHVQRCRRSKPQGNPDQRSSVRRKLVLDGNNIAFHMSRNGTPQASKLLQAYRSLKVAGYRPIIVVSAALKYRIDKPEILQSLKNRKIVVESPRGTDDDLTIIRLAKQRNANIVSNDRFLDWRERYPKLDSRLIRYRMTPSGLILL